jgi:hypothetical protein
MGPRPLDFDEEMIKHSPTFVKWQCLEEGEKLRYACREFVKGIPDEEERLMRRIMIARRNNIRDHETVKEARRRIITTTTTTTSTSVGNQNAAIAGAVAADSLEEVLLASTNTKAAATVAFSEAAANKTDMVSVNKTDIVSTDEVSPATVKTESDGATTISIHRKNNKRKSPTALTDTQIEQEMDKEAVEATRSYKAWSALPDGAEFIYNQKYIKGQPDHDWSLRKNIWRRMRYRRENKKMVQDYKQIVTSSFGTIPRQRYIGIPTANPMSTFAAGNMSISTVNTVRIATHTQTTTTTNHEESSSLLSADRAAVEAAVAAAQNFPAVDPAVAVAASLVAAANPLMESPVAQAALDAAAQLAAAQTKVEDDDDDEDEDQDGKEHISESE